MAKIPIAVQLYSVRDDCAKDLPGVLKGIGKMGYEGVEFAGYYNNDAKTLRKLLDDNGLKAEGTHIGIESFLGDQFYKTVEFHKILGCDFLIIPSMSKQRRDSVATCKETGRLLSEISERLRPYDLRTGYHAHGDDFTPLPDEKTTGYDALFSNSDKSVIMQIDTGNAKSVGVDAVPFIERYPGRTLTIHIKDFSKTKQALLGEGDVPFKEVLRACQKVGGTRWFVVEQETYPYPPMECIDRNLKTLKRML